MNRYAERDATGSVPFAPSDESAGRVVRITLLCAMMFLQYAVWGAWAPVLALHLQGLGFMGIQIGQVYGTMAIASMIAPWLAGQLADRVMHAQHVLALSHLVGAVVLWITAAQRAYETVYLLALVYAMLYVPTLALSNLIALRHITQRDRDFGLIRLWGTIGWILASYAFGRWLARPDWLPLAKHAVLGDCLRMAAILSAALALLSLALPATPPLRDAARTDGFAPLKALRLLRHRAFAVLMLVGFLLAVAMPFYYQQAAPFLRSCGVPEPDVTSWLLIGQVCEIAVLALMPLFVKGIGVKATFLIGILAWSVRFFAFSAGQPWALVAASLPLHGFCFAFVFALGQIYVDKHADADIRASAQALFTFVTLGLGMWLGNLAAGYATDEFKLIAPDGAKVVDFGRVFLWPAVGAAACFLFFLILFRETSEDEAPRPAQPDR